MSGDFSLANQSVSPELTEDRWRRIQALFHAAYALPQSERNKLVELATASDPGLGRQVAEMLATASTAAGLLAQTVSAVARAAIGPADWVGRRVGPYRLVREIGRGGMGLIFEACRDDDEYRKTVALKLAPEWRDSQTLGERLRHERQILAGLDHPNIAHFLDGGSQEGIPYFAMEYVEGVPITAFCEALGLRTRIELFLQVCAAVHYAHERLVVHRDLKPANILVTRDGVPKLLDFGIAKLLSPLPGSAAATAGMRLWTPDYTSPEQIRGDAITTRTDVYLLGLVLWELLCGEKAQAVDAAFPLALHRAVCETDPGPPSRRAAAHGNRALCRQLRGDLDTIVAMAIRKEPERRYGSAAALSEDLRRYLENRPVEARPGSAAYRLWKLARRHRVVVAAGVLVAITTTAGAFATVYQARRAERRFQEVRKLANSVLFGVDDRIRNLAGATEAREWAVTNALSYLDNLSTDAGDDASLLYELATAYQKVGDVQGYSVGPSLGHPDAALASHRKGLAIAERLVARDRAPKIRRLVAKGHQRVAALRRVFHQTGPALEEYRRALAVADALCAEQPGNPEDSDLLAGILITMGQAEIVAGHVAAAGGHWARAFAVTSQWAAAYPGDQSRSAQGRSQRMVVRGLLYTGDLDNAARQAEEHIRRCETLSAAQPANAAFRRELMNSYIEMAYVYAHPAFLSYGDPQTAVSFHLKAVELARELAGKDAKNATAQLDLSLALADICGAISSYDPARALAYCRDALASGSRWPQQFIPDTVLAYEADALKRLGRRTEARDALRRTLELRAELVSRDPSHFTLRQQLMRAHNQMASILLDLGDRARSLESQRQAFAMAEALAAENPTNLLCRRDLTDVYEGFGRYYQAEDRRQALTWYQKSLDVWTVWPASAPSTRMDRARRDKAARAVAQCGASPPAVAQHP